MKTLSKYLILLLAAICFLPDAWPQNNIQDHIDINNGLPSNHVYYLLKDRNGYLWIATKNGVMKYNGYELRKFDVSDGLPNNDVWALYEDRKGRIWLHSIASEVGYIYNDRYKPVPVKEGNAAIYTKYIRDVKDGVMFLSPYNDPASHMKLHYEKNDIVYTYNIPNYHGYATTASFMHDKGFPVVVNGNAISKLTIDSGKVKPVFLCRKPPVAPGFKEGTCCLFGDNLVTFNTSVLFHSLDIDNCNTRVLRLSNRNDEFLYTPYIYKDRLYFATDKNVYQYNYGMQKIKTSPKAEVLPESHLKDNYIVNLLDDPFWGICVGTGNDGLYINYHADGYKKRKDILIKNAVHVGRSAQYTHFWWNKSSKTLTGIDSFGHISNRVYPQIDDVHKIVDYTAERSLILSKNGLYWMEKDGRLTRFGSSFRIFLLNGDTVKSNDLNDYINSITDLAFISPNECYAVGMRKHPFYTRWDNEVFQMDLILEQRMPSVRYNSSTKTMFAFNDKMMLSFKNGEAPVIIKGDLLNAYKIRKVENIVTDEQYGNVFVKDYDKLCVFHAQKKVWKELLENYNMSNVSCDVVGETLIAAGKFGIAFSKILGPAELSAPVVYKNIRNIHYNNIYDIQASPGSILLNTDKGIYTIAMPPDSSFKTVSDNYSRYKLLINYRDTTINITTNDTLFIDQENKKFQFDIINPQGNGSVSYFTCISGRDTAWTESNGKAFFFPELEAGRYYTLCIRARDDVWKSSVITTTLYIRPYWWQTTTGKRITWLAGIILILLALWAVVHVTRRIVNRKNQKKNLKLELKNLQLTLELKSIYSQINPHFIFNTLSTGLYFIKKNRINDAYEHIASFSHLLRSYISSSRNRYISIAEEQENLENYIQLQQARFEDKFDYQIIVHDSIDARTDRIPSLLLQPIVENAITHGLFHKEDKGHLTIGFKKEQNAITCMIDDDGVGREQAKAFTRGSGLQQKSYGTDLIKDLIHIFNTYEETKIEIQYTDKEWPLTGTTVSITIQKLTS